MANRIVVLYVDTIGVIDNFVGGSGKSTDTGSLVHALRIWENSARPYCWFEHVPSWANLAYGGSRIGTECPATRSAGVQL